MGKIIWKKTSEEKTDQVVQRFERKFFVYPRQKYLASSLLLHLCKRDREYPENKVNSLYFDTPDLDEYIKSDEGDYKREKVRIRWYDNPLRQTGMIPVWLELKYKRGFAGMKKRRKFLVPVESFRRITVDNTIIDRHLMLKTLSEFGYCSEKPLIPLIVIRYKRYRFSEMMTGTRISFDWEVKSTLASPWLGYGEVELELEGGVIEIKGPEMQIPHSLLSLKTVYTDWSRFSKFAGSVEAHIEKPGMIGRFWPSGKTGL